MVNELPGSFLVEVAKRRHRIRLRCGARRQSIGRHWRVVGARGGTLRGHVLRCCEGVDCSRNRCRGGVRGVLCPLVVCVSFAIAVRLVGAVGIVAVVPLVPLVVVGVVAVLVILVVVILPDALYLHGEVGRISSSVRSSRSCSTSGCASLWFCLLDVGVVLSPLLFAFLCLYLFLSSLLLYSYPFDGRTRRSP